MSKQEILQKLFNPRRHQLPTLPVLFVEMQKLLDNPFCSSHAISDLIKKDQSMVSKIIQLSNSALYGRLQETKLVDNAITYLGTETLRNLVLQICLVRILPVNKSALPEFSAQNFWKHSLATAFFSDRLAMMLRLPGSDQYYLGGLLHDLGKVLLYQFHPDLFEKAVMTAIQENLSGFEAENGTIGIDHADIGAFLAEAWKFDATIVNVIANHHQLLPSRMNLATAIVSLANDYANLFGLGMPWDNTDIDQVAKQDAWEWIRKNQNLMGLEPDNLVFELSQHVPEISSSVDVLLNQAGERA